MWIKPKKEVINVPGLTNKVKKKINFKFILGYISNLELSDNKETRRIKTVNITSFNYRKPEHPLKYNLLIYT